MRSGPLGDWVRPAVMTEVILITPLEESGEVETVQQAGEVMHRWIPFNKQGSFYLDRLFGSTDIRHDDKEVICL